LRLSDRIAFYRDALRRPVKPEVMEPAHFRYIDPGARGAVAEELLTKIRAMLEKYR
jgi:hypothetical protein